MGGLAWGLLVRKGMSKGVVMQQGRAGGHGVPDFLDSFPSDLRGLEGAQHAFQHTSDM